MNKIIRPPVYNSGFFYLLRIEESVNNDFPEETLKKTGETIWFRELSIYDRLRYELGQGGKEVTMKIRIPECREISSSRYCCEIGGIIHEIYNAAHGIPYNGYSESELTLIAPEKNRKVIND